jgi:hypothetical protein
MISGGLYSDGTTTRATRMLGILSDGRLFFTNTGRGSGNYNNVDLVNLPPASTAAIYALSYKDSNRASQFRINNPLLGVYSRTLADPIPAVPNDETWIGHYSGSGYEGWTGKASQIFIFDRALGDTNVTLLGELMAVLRGLYGIS